ncbi:MAG: hypothetical protein WD749_02040 [Phycisphaerales bacterium]
MDWVTERLPTDGKTPVTRLWISKRAQKGMNKDAPTTFDSQLDRWQANGFPTYLTVSVRAEPFGTWRIGPGGNEFRLLGFFEFGNPDKDPFIAILGGWKPPRKIYQQWFVEVARVRDTNDWRRVVPQMDVQDTARRASP